MQVNTQIMCSHRRIAHKERRYTVSSGGTILVLMKARREGPEVLMPATTSGSDAGQPRPLRITPMRSCRDASHWRHPTMSWAGIQRTVPARTLRRTEQACVT